MQKREFAKSGGQSGGSSAPPAKRDRPFGSTSAAAAAAAAAAETMSPAEQQENSAGLQSGLKSEVTWALNTLTLLSFKERDDIRRDFTPLAKIPGLLDALLLIIDDWRDIALPKDLTRGTKVRSFGMNSSVTGLGTESGVGSAAGEVLGKKNKHQSSQWWNEEDGLFNLDVEGRAEKQLCAVAASNVICNFSFMPDNEVVMAQHRHCLETVYQCINDHMTGKEKYCVLLPHIRL
ncbi:BnaC05g16160D [Brassica napus]|uniref:(rape) hypothetical protein n=1 Tax=Brassica napus TaxID=3708 RepID=A0A078H1Z2_BRANA|nr:unnamed protein product [Brassica napus]CDY31507.1 BnaC05g16160D [Brassica napus]